MDPTESSASFRLPTEAEFAAFASSNIAEARRRAWRELHRTARGMVAEAQKGLGWIDDHREEIRDFWHASRKQLESEWRFLLDLIDPLTDIDGRLAEQRGLIEKGRQGLNLAPAVTTSSQPKGAL